MTKVYIHINYIYMQSTISSNPFPFFQFFLQEDISIQQYNFHVSVVDNKKGHSSKYNI